MDSQTHEILNIRFINQIFNSMADGVFTLDSEGRISSWNRSMERISWYAAQEALLDLLDEYDWDGELSGRRGGSIRACRRG
ncbi:MAG: PAS domain-containing protein [Deltaproteobacteria bacterium]|nr:PAS domain-containing protein [Deltaproteobacteria bacterium]